MLALRPWERCAKATRQEEATGTTQIAESLQKMETLNQTPPTPPMAMGVKRHRSVRRDALQPAGVTGRARAPHLR
jgi:hypothetical protein